MSTKQKRPARTQPDATLPLEAGVDKLAVANVTQIVSDRPEEKKRETRVHTEPETVEPTVLLQGIRLPKSTHARFKVACARRGVPMNKTSARLIAEWLDAEGE